MIELDDEETVLIIKALADYRKNTLHSVEGREKIDRLLIRLRGFNSRRRSRARREMTRLLERSSLRKRDD